MRGRSRARSQFSGAPGITVLSCVSLRAAPGFRPPGLVVAVGGWGTKRLLWVPGLSPGPAGRPGRTGLQQWSFRVPPAVPLQGVGAQARLWPQARGRQPSACPHSLLTPTPRGPAELPPSRCESREAVCCGCHCVSTIDLQSPGGGETLDSHSDTSVRQSVSKFGVREI